MIGLGDIHTIWGGGKGEGSMVENSPSTEYYIGLVLYTKTYNLTQHGQKFTFESVTYKWRYAMIGRIVIGFHWESVRVRLL